MAEVLAYAWSDYCAWLDAPDAAAARPMSRDRALAEAFSLMLGLLILRALMYLMQAQQRPDLSAGTAEALDPPWSH